MLNSSHFVICGVASMNGVLTELEFRSRSPEQKTKPSSSITFCTSLLFKSSLEIHLPFKSSLAISNLKILG
ncbi:hypothetical protein R6Q57_012708 [Mikania cordata]